jgi:hypothetical protein
MRIATLAPGDRGKGLDNDFDEPNSSTLKLKKPQGINHLKILEEISIKWLRTGFYDTPDKALSALIRGVL